MLIVGALRVKNECRWIERCLRSLLPICDRIIVLDDHSTDGTPDLAAGIAPVNIDVIDSPFEGLDEVRDKNVLLDVCRSHEPDWVVMIDGDEELSYPHELLRAMETTAARALAMRVLYLWDRPDQVRIDGVYSSLTRVSAFRLGEERFEPTGPRGFHCGNAPQQIPGRALVDAPLLHYGYMHRSDRLRKYDWYRAQDPGNVSEDEYRHIVIGDVFPADSQFRHAGPLALQSLSRP